MRCGGLVAVRRVPKGALVMLGLLFLLGCGKNLPNPVESRDGQTWIPIADTAFLIPDKAWLKGYARYSTSGMVCCIDLHAMPPNVRPWSEADSKRMYPNTGRGERVDIYLKEILQPSSFQQRFPHFPQSIWGGGDLVEEASDLGSSTLHKFKERRTDGSLQPGKVFYEDVEEGRVKYFALCSDLEGLHGATDLCNLTFPYKSKFEVTLTFSRAYMADGPAMANKVIEKLKEFEAGGAAGLKDKNQ